MAHNSQLVLRTISTIGNYDYIFDVRFLLGGTIKIRVFAAGYMECNCTKEHRPNTGPS